MPKKRPTKNNLTRLREGLELSQPDFAKRFGVSASIIKKLEAGTRTITPELSARIFAETGILFMSAPEEEPLEFTKADHAAWKKQILFDQKSVKGAERIVMKLIELMMAASARPGVEKSYVVFNALVQAIERVKNEFQMEKHIDAELRDRQSTDTRLYPVGELRRNDLLAKQVGFKDDPKLKDEDQIPLTKTVGWLPAKELFNIRWQHQELMKTITASGAQEPTEAQKTELVEMEKKLDKEVDAFMPRDLR
jgi:transcriptional regulator with XRE-family HTH domain